VLNAHSAEVRRLKRQGHHAAIHGNRFWHSSWLLIEHLRRAPPRAGSRVLEIGCGWGLPGIFCARYCACAVTAVDADRNVFPYLELHAALNGAKVRTQRLRFEQLTVERLRAFDLLLGADICFWDHLEGPLFNLVRRARRAGVGRILIADPGRSPFTRLAERCGEAFPDLAAVRPIRLRRPVSASGEILVIGDGAAARLAKPSAG
jgi:predicted nicotinamide N-methyase